MAMKMIVLSVKQSLQHPYSLPVFEKKFRGYGMVSLREVVCSMQFLGPAAMAIIPVISVSVEISHYELGIMDPP